jgi:hypothetical protein
MYIVMLVCDTAHTTPCEAYHVSEYYLTIPRYTVNKTLNSALFNITDRIKRKKNHFLRPISQPQTSHALARDRTRVSAVKYRQTNTYATFHHVTM